MPYGDAVTRQDYSTVTEPSESRHFRPNQLHAVSGWVGIVAGVVFIVAVVFFAGFFIGRGSSDHVRGNYERDDDRYPGMMYPGQMGPGMMGPFGSWAPGQQWPTASPTPTTSRP